MMSLIYKPVYNRREGAREAIESSAKGIGVEIFIICGADEPEVGEVRLPTLQLQEWISLIDIRNMINRSNSNPGSRFSNANVGIATVVELAVVVAASPERTQRAN